MCPAERWAALPTNHWRHGDQMSHHQQEIMETMWSQIHWWCPSKNHTVVHLHLSQSSQCIGCLWSRCFMIYGFKSMAKYICALFKVIMCWCLRSQPRETMRFICWPCYHECCVFVSFRCMESVRYLFTLTHRSNFKASPAQYVKVDRWLVNCVFCIHLPNHRNKYEVCWDGLGLAPVQTLY